MFSKINFCKIVQDHHGTLKDYSTGKTSRGDLLLFYGFPFILGTLLVISGCSIDKDLATILVTGFSVFAALLFNLQLLIYTVVERVKSEAGAPDNKRRIFLQEIYYNVSFSILLCIVTIVVIFIRFFVAEWLNAVVSWTIMWLSTMFILTLFMVLKRVHALLGSEFKK